VRKDAPLVSLRETVKRTIAELGSRAPLEYAMQDLVSQGMQIAAVDTGGLRWFEVDTPDDLAIAENLFGPASGDPGYEASERPAAP
jgi:NDP-sugar pyrophosphorylase family protein